MPRVTRSGGSVAIFEVDVPVGAKVPIAHSHDSYEETIYGIEGILTWTVEGRASDVGLHEVLCIPRGTVHASTTIIPSDAKILAIVTPGILGPDYFREIAAVVHGAVGPPDPSAIAEVMRRHGPDADTLSPASCTLEVNPARYPARRLQFGAG
jgi:quercetin dioxygenase-like cupin family protein